MPWYKSGTVSVALNSNAVIGTGTAFIANSRVGDAFRGPDGGWYEVTNIASDTAMSISPSYQGATNAAGVYALAPMQGYIKDSADALRSLVTQFGSILAVLGPTATVPGVRNSLGLANSDGMPEGVSNLYFTTARVIASALTGFVTTSSSAVVAADSIVVAAGKLQAQVSGKASKGANNDITSITGLTTALSVAQGGTGKTSLGAAALGAVSQAGGIPTGAIIENGANANGRYIKYADGTLICIGGIGITASGTLVAAGSATLPYAMIDASYYVGATMIALIATQGFSLFRATRSQTAITLDFWSVSGGAATGTSAAAYIAIGRWF